MTTAHSPSASQPSWWQSVAAEAAVLGRRANVRYVYLPEIDSTNRYLIESASQQHAAPLLVHAGKQTAGQGRRGRHWHHKPEHSLAFSLGVPLHPPTWEGLSLAVGLAVAQALRGMAHANMQSTIKVKWPNDIWLHTPDTAQANTPDKKLGGILIQTTAAANAHTPHTRYAVIGIGLNIRPISLPAATPSDADNTPAALPPAHCAECLPDELLTEQALLQHITPALLRTLAIFEQDGFAPLREAYHEYDALLGRTIRTQDGLVGQAHGVDAEGGLRIRTDDGRTHTFKGLEVSVRPHHTIC